MGLALVIMVLTSTTTGLPVLVRGADNMAVQVTVAPVCTSYSIAVKHVSDQGTATIATITESNAGAGASYIAPLSGAHGYVSASVTAISGCTVSAYLMALGGGL